MLGDRCWITNSSLPDLPYTEYLVHQYPIASIAADSPKDKVRVPNHGPTLQTSCDDPFAVFTCTNKRDHRISYPDPPDPLEAQRCDDQVCCQLWEVCERHRGLMRESASGDGELSRRMNHDDRAVAHCIFLKAWYGIKVSHNMMDCK